MNRPTPKSLSREKHVVVVNDCSMHDDPQVKEIIEGEYERFFSNEFVALKDEMVNASPHV